MRRETHDFVLVGRPFRRQLLDLSLGRRGEGPIVGRSVPPVAAFDDTFLANPP
jgi:hypothetical protein